MDVLYNDIIDGRCCQVIVLQIGCLFLYGFSFTTDMNHNDTCSFLMKSPKLTHCILGNFSWFFVVCWFFSNLTFWKNSFRNTIWMSNSLDPDQAQRIVGPDLGPNCLPKLSADDTGRQRVKWVQLVRSPGHWQVSKAGPTGP